MKFSIIFFASILESIQRNIFRSDFFPEYEREPEAESCLTNMNSFVKSKTSVCACMCVRVTMRACARGWPTRLYYVEIQVGLITEVIPSAHSLNNGR